MTATKTLISMPEAFLEEIDSFARKQHRTRSELIRQALREYIQQANERKGN